MLYRPLKLKRSVRSRQEALLNLQRGERKAIVVALDGHRSAEKSFPHAVQLARRWDAPIHLVQVLLPKPYWDLNESAVLFENEWLSEREQAEAYLESVAQAIAAASNIAVTAEITNSVSVESELSSLSAEVGRMLIVAKPPRSELSQVFSGSVTNSLVSRTRVPLLIVPTESSSEESERTDYQRILVCAGHGDVSENVLSAAAFFGADAAACRLLHVFPLRAKWTSTRASRFLPVDLRQSAMLRLHAAERWLTRQQINAAVHLVDDWRHSPAEAILSEADTFSADLMILGTRRRILPWWLRGGLPESIAQRSKRPVLLVPQEDNFSTPIGDNHVDIYSN